jgi:hypothetical protein
MVPLSLPHTHARVRVCRDVRASPHLVARRLLRHFVVVRARVLVPVLELRGPERECLQFTRLAGDGGGGARTRTHTHTPPRRTATQRKGHPHTSCCSSSARRRHAAASVPSCAASACQRSHAARFSLACLVAAASLSASAALRCVFVFHAVCAACCVMPPQASANKEQEPLLSSFSQGRRCVHSRAPDAHTHPPTHTHTPYTHTPAAPPRAAAPRRARARACRAPACSRRAGCRSRRPGGAGSARSSAAPPRCCAPLPARPAPPAAPPPWRRARPAAALWRRSARRRGARRARRRARARRSPARRARL